MEHLTAASTMSKSSKAEFFKLLSWHALLQSPQHMSFGRESQAVEYVPGSPVLQLIL